MKRMALLLLLLAGCDPDEERAAAEPPRDRPAAAKAPPRPAPALDPRDLDEAKAAAATLRLYYDHVGARRYRDAWRLRADRSRLSYEAFAASFDRYADYRATVGTPTLPAEAEGSLFVEVPVQLYGRTKEGAPFGSVGSVTMRRGTSGAAGERGWKVGG